MPTTIGSGIRVDAIRAGGLFRHAKDGVVSRVSSSLCRVPACLNVRATRVPRGGMHQASDCGTQRNGFAWRCPA
ncbi:protein of unknown function [Pararobbsia alpina]